MELLWYYRNIPSSEFEIIHIFFNLHSLFLFSLFISCLVCSSPFLSSFLWWGFLLGWGTYRDSFYSTGFVLSFDIIPLFLMYFQLSDAKVVPELSCTPGDLNLKLTPFSKKLYFLYLVKYLVCCKHHISYDHSVFCISVE